MKHEDVVARNANISAWLSHLPRKMLTIPGHDQLPVFVLHELCHEGCFNLVKAASSWKEPEFIDIHAHYKNKTHAFRDLNKSRRLGPRLLISRFRLKLVQNNL